MKSNVRIYKVEQLPKRLKEYFTPKNCMGPRPFGRIVRSIRKNGVDKVAYINLLGAQTPFYEGDGVMVCHDLILNEGLLSSRGTKLTREQTISFLVKPIKDFSDDNLIMRLLVEDLRPYVEYGPPAPSSAPSSTVRSLLGRLARRVTGMTYGASV